MIIRYKLSPSTSIALLDVNCPPPTSIAPVRRQLHLPTSNALALENVACARFPWKQDMPDSFAMLRLICVWKWDNPEVIHLQQGCCEAAKVVNPTIK